MHFIYKKYLFKLKVLGVIVSVVALVSVTSCSDNESDKWTDSDIDILKYNSESIINHMENYRSKNGIYPASAGVSLDIINNNKLSSYDGEKYNYRVYDNYTRFVLDIRREYKGDYRFQYLRYDSRTGKWEYSDIDSRF